MNCQGRRETCPWPRLRAVLARSPRRWLHASSPRSLRQCVSRFRRAVGCDANRCRAPLGTTQRAAAANASMLVADRCPSYPGASNRPRRRRLRPPTPCPSDGGATFGDLGGRSVPSGGEAGLPLPMSAADPMARCFCAGPVPSVEHLDRVQRAALRWSRVGQNKARLNVKGAVPTAAPRAR